MIYLNTREKVFQTSDQKETHSLAVPDVRKEKIQVIIVR
tara:strand:+ start:29 stop:145 length:117 start_codon:yes stop_codon:yes gene_type:complete